MGAPGGVVFHGAPIFCPSGLVPWQRWSPGSWVSQTSGFRTETDRSFQVLLPPQPIGKQKWSGVSVCHSMDLNSKTSTSAASTNEVPSGGYKLKVCLSVCEWVGWWGAVLMCSLLWGVLCREVTPLSLPFLLVDYISQEGRGPDSWNHHCSRSMWLQTEALLFGQLQPTQKALEMNWVTEVAKRGNDQTFQIIIRNVHFLGFCCSGTVFRTVGRETNRKDYFLCSFLEGFSTSCDAH